jgi:hypothetical protein
MWWDHFKSMQRGHAVTWDEFKQAFKSHGAPGVPGLTRGARHVRHWSSRGSPPHLLAARGPRRTSWPPADLPAMLAPPLGRPWGSPTRSTGRPRGSPAD